MIAALLALLAVAEARPLTYCVGGYTGSPPRVQAACGRPDVARQHGDWHEHFWVTDGRQCMICWDEVDNSCYDDFVVNNPQWQPTVGFLCRGRATWGDGLTVFEHVIGGETVSAAPPPAPEVLTPRLAVETPGPYVAGDAVRVVGTVAASDGIRGVGGGIVEVYAGDELVDRVRGTVRPDGSVAAEVSLPASDRVRLRFVPEAPLLNPGDTLAAASSDALALNVDTCGYRARVVAPQPGEALASGQSVTLRAALLAPDGVPASPGALALRYTVQADGQPAAVIEAQPDGSARWTPPAAEAPVTWQVFATGRADGRVVCHAGPVEVQVSDLGLGFDRSKLPAICYTGLDCVGEVTLLRPAPGAARQRVDRLLGDPATEVVLLEGARELARTPPRADDRYAFSQRFDHPRRARWKLEVRGPDGTVAMPFHELEVRPALVVRLPDALDLGVVPAGSRALDHCTELDFSASEAAEEHEWRLVVDGLAGCRGRPLLAVTTPAGRVRTYALDAPITVGALDPDHPAMTFCLDAPRCAGEVSPDGVVLHVTPTTPVFADQARALPVRWEVSRRAWWRCHLWWAAPGLGGLFALWALLGVIRPARFPANASIRVAGRERDLDKAVSVLLRDCPGSGAGFWRDARLGLHHDGDVNGRIRNAAVVLQADRGAGVVLAGAAPLEQHERRGGWRPVEDLPTGHVPGPGKYRIGELYFKVDAG